MWRTKCGKSPSGKEPEMCEGAQPLSKSPHPTPIPGDMQGCKAAEQISINPSGKAAEQISA